MGEADKPVIDVRELRVEFPGRRGSVTALSDVSLSIKAGEILGVVGESGAGKSMTGLAIQGLLERPGHISGGEIWLSGRRIDQLNDQAMEQIRGREIGAIFQDPLTSLNPLFTVGAQLGETIRQHLPVSKREAKLRAIQLLRDVGIPSPEERVKQYPHQFSGGMRQRVVIALALAASPKLVIADEPTTALDVSIQAQVISLLRKLCKEKQTAVLLVTHDMGVIAEAADRVAVMYAGRLIELGPVEQVLHAPRHPYTQGLMASIPSLDGRVEKLSQIDGSMPRLDAIPIGCAFSPRCSHAGPRCLKERPELTFAGEGASACWLNAGGTA
ncbi:ABC transporter ATP-binding protein [Nitratireductor sp. OM-1]|uniref:ABC transporter ATP-binding protein n=1 Tax=Nitratireductor sp. OM-1 TaxID=1756988 RepID=UPI000DE11A05|nr:ABC transporter ATP-binding protein [Nitratireductor sp. OM-1]